MSNEPNKHLDLIDEIHMSHDAISAINTLMTLVSEQTDSKGGMVIGRTTISNACMAIDLFAIRIRENATQLCEMLIAAQKESAHRKVV